MPRPIAVRFDAAAWRNNLRVVRARAPLSKVWSVVKANAYGHGLLRAAEALADTDGFALLDLNEAVRLREAGVRQPILLLEGGFDPSDFILAGQHDLTPVLHHETQLWMLEEARPECLFKVYLKVNSGMNRLGFSGTQVREAYARLAALPQVGEITLMTHFADADGPTGVAAQLARFKEWTAGIGAPHCMANSAATLKFPEAHGAWVRPGIALYGASPFPIEMQGWSAADLGLQPVMTLTSELIATQHLQAGEGIGYGYRYVAERAMRIGVVACGYADGYPRHAPPGNAHGVPVLVDGVRTRTVGRVAMDMLYVDLSALPQAQVGSQVTLWGAGLPADEVGEACGTLSYEMFCALAARVPVVAA